MSKNKHLEKAVTTAKKKLANDNTAVLCGILGCSGTYLYNCVVAGEAGLPLALKLETLLEGEFHWRLLAPKAAKKIDAVKNRNRI